MSRHTLVEVRRRLAPGAPFIVAHHSLPQAPGEKSLWLDRFAAFATAPGISASQMRSAAVAIGERLPTMSPEEDVVLLREAGFSGIALFYAAFTFRGWVGYA